MFRYATAFLLLSGIASLTYQVAWVRLLGLTMGSTSASISTVLTAFFLGLALGSYFAEKITRNRIESFTPYLILELIIGLSALLLLPLLLNLDQIMAWFPQWGTALWFKFTITLLLLIVPTICMGATFPVMAALLIRQSNTMGRRISELYSFNTWGAVLGAGLSGFVFIPWFGLDGAVYSAFAINMLIVVLIVYFKNSLVVTEVEIASSTFKPLGSSVKIKLRERIPFQRRALLVLFFTGFISIACEVGWTKYLSIFTGSTIYGFAAILTVFLAGIATGSWVMRYYIETLKAPALWMAIGLALLGLSLILTRVFLTTLPDLYEFINHLAWPVALRHLAKYTLVFLFLFTPTFIFGALFPLNLKLYCGSLQGIRARIGKAYAVNTLASIAGSLVAGFLIIPIYGTDWLLTVSALVIVALPLMFLFSLKGAVIKTSVTAILVATVFGSYVLPHLDYKNLIAAVEYQFDHRAASRSAATFLYLGEGKAGVISAVTYDGKIAKLQNNGLNESIIDLHNPRNRLVVESLLGLMPYLLQSNAQSAFIIGFGGGHTTEAMTWTKLKSIRVVELEPKVIDAVQTIYKGLLPPALHDRRVTLDFNDARNTLLVEQRRYDIIASQPSHPWRAGAANLFTQEFFVIVKSRLNDNGVFSQWLNLFGMDVYTLKSVMKSFYAAFPHGFSLVNVSTGDMILIGSPAEIQIDFDAINKVLATHTVKTNLAFSGIGQARDLLWYFCLSRDEMVKLSRDVQYNTDTNILTETRLSALDGQPKLGSSEDPYQFLSQNYTMDFLNYLPKNKRAAQAQEVARLFVEQGQFAAAEKIAVRLSLLNPALADAIRYQIALRTSDFRHIEFFIKTIRTGLTRHLLF